jgi:hypothetical protein
MAEPQFLEAACGKRATNPVAAQNFNGTWPEFEFKVPLFSRTTSLGLYAQ